jgi:hypothetical protein
MAAHAFTTACGGLFLFLPDLVRLGIEGLAEAARLPGSKMIPAPHALRSALALKLWSIERKSHVMSLVADPGLALFAGLNAIPKKSYLSEYSHRIDHAGTTRVLAGWHDALSGDKLFTGESFNLDFHSVPYFGEHPTVERHYVSMRSRRQPSVLAFLAQDAASRAFCYSNADLRKGEEAGEIFRFIDFWRKHHGQLPRHLVFDSKLTTYAALARLDAMGIEFITLRRRSHKLLAEIATLPRSAWRTVELEGVTRRTHHPRDQPTQDHTIATHHAVRAANADRKRALGCSALFPPGRAFVGSGDEGRLRHGTAGSRERALSPFRKAHARLRRGAGATDLPRPHPDAR